MRGLIKGQQLLSATGQEVVEGYDRSHPKGTQQTENEVNRMP